MNWEEQLGLKFTAFIAGIVGGIVSLTFEAKLSFIRALTLILVGGSTAGYSFEFVYHYFNVKTQVSGFFGFCIGLISMRLVNGLIVIGNSIQKNPAMLLSIPKFFQFLKDESRTNTINNGNSSNTNSDLHSTGKDSDEGESTR